MSRQLKRIMVACGFAASTGAFFGSGLVNPPDEEKKIPAPKQVAPAKQPAEKPAEKAEKPGEKGEKPVVEKPAEKAPPTEKEDTHATKPAAEPAHGPSKVKGDAKPGKDEHADDEHDAAPSADDALQQLKDGNLRWVKDKETNPNTDASRRSMVAEEGQKPFATILTCADSRIPVERVFDRGVGDLFVIRVAGNVVGSDASGTIEYGSEHLHVPLLVVMGHTKCGAVAAAASGAQPGGNVNQLVEKISPAVIRARQAHPELDDKALAAEAVRENVWQSIFDLIRTSETVRELVQQHKLQVVGAVYDVATGKVDWIGEHPWQESLVEAFQSKPAKGTEQAEAHEEH